MKGHALVVEDDAALRDMVRAYLEMLDWGVDEASDGRKAMAALRAKKFDVVVLDLTLPESSGYDVLEFMGNNDLGSTPVLMTSARSLPGDRAHAEELGARLYLTKPFTRAEFSRAIESMTEGT
ncbi:MAG: response regulator [Archangiaceae bacterium]|nr:response regulator [Archangiaceae bacterium]